MTDKFGYIFESILYFFPYIVFVGFVALVCGMFSYTQFRKKDDSRLVRAMSGFPYYLVFSFLGLVTAYFLSLGLTETESGFTNAILGPFATALVSLLTAGLALFSKKEWKDFSETSVLIGVITYLLCVMVLYKSMALDALRTATGS